MHLPPKGDTVDLVNVEPYGVLGLPHGASFEEVRRAYRRLAQASHPDTNGPSGVDRFISVQSAYEAITRERQGAVYGPTGAAIVPRSVAVPDVVFSASPPPSPLPRVDLFATLAPISGRDAVEAYLRHTRIPPPALVDVCC